MFTVFRSHRHQTSSMSSVPRDGNVEPPTHLHRVRQGRMQQHTGSSCCFLTPQLTGQQDGFQSRKRSHCRTDTSCRSWVTCTVVCTSDRGKNHFHQQTLPPKNHFHQSQFQRPLSSQIPLKGDRTKHVWVPKTIWSVFL